MRSLNRINRKNRKGLNIGYWEIYYEDGSIHSRGSCKNGLREGMWKTYYLNGNLANKCSYINGIKEGIWEYYWNTGKIGDLKLKRLYENDFIVEVLPIR